MALNTRCQKCRHLLGPEDAVGAVTNPALCCDCRERAAKEAATPSLHPAAVTGRQKKALAMVVVIDGDAIKRGLSPFDQAGRIVLISREWTDAIWEQIGVRAGYERKAISKETRETVRSIYRGRAQAPLQSKRAS